jgi:hypothetical protein
MTVFGDLEVFTSLARYRIVIALNHGISKLCCLLTHDCGDLRAELKIFKSATIFTDPGHEPYTLSVVIPASQKKFGSDQRLN